MISQTSDTVAALVAGLRGPDGGVSAETVANLPLELAISLGLYLVRDETPAGRDAAGRIFDAIRAVDAVAGKLDDERGRLALAVGRPEEAVRLLEARLDRREALSGYQILVRAYLDLGRNDEALALARRLADEQGERITAWQILGEAELATGDPAAGADAHRRALALAPNGSGALLGLACCLAALGEEEEARELVARVEAVYGGSPSAWALREVMEVAKRLGDAEWAGELRALRAERDASEGTRLGATLRAMLATAAPAAAPQSEGEMAGREDAAVEPIEEEPPAPELLDALRDTFGHESFLPGQATIVGAALRGEDVLALMPTGAGKSLCYQLPALLLPGTTVLISPLIALMKDQLDNLPAAARAQATVVNSMVERDELERRLRDVAAGRYRLVYAAPERLRQQSFVYALRRAGVARFVVDEAHCVSLWGHDFRPDYLFIARALAALEQDGRRIPVLALTATATPEVRDGVGEALGRGLRVVNRGVFRPNLRYEVVPVGNNEDRMRALAALLRETPGAGIVYVRSREGCEEVAEFLRRRCGVSAIHYHAGMERAAREAAQDAFLTGRARVVVATVAFGMGIDKPDVRFIVHYQLPGSLEAYVQESGRAGRDGQPSRCVLFVSTADVSLLRRHVRQDELSIETLRAVYAATRDLVRAGAPPGAAIGRVAAADLERAVGEAIQLAQAAQAGQGGRSEARAVDETSARVALSLLERCGFLRRHPDAPRAPTVRLLDDPAASDARAGDLRAFAAAARLRPRQFQTVDLVAVAAALGLAPSALEERLLGWRDAGLIEYRDGARDLLIEVCPPPPDGKERLPALLGELAARHERQVASLVAYAQTAACRQAVIARHFGERLPAARCGVCDRCRPDESAQPARPSNRKPRPPRVRDDATLRGTILACLRDLPYAVGVSGVIRVLRGSADVAASGAKSPHFGALAGVGEARLKREIEAMVAEGLLARDAAGEYPLLRVVG